MSLDQCNNKYNTNIPEYYGICKAIPEQWKDLLRDTVENKEIDHNWYWQYHQYRNRVQIIYGRLCTNERLL